MKRGVETDALGHDTFFKTIPYISVVTSAKKCEVFKCFKMCSGSDRIRIAFGRLDPDPDPGWQKMTHKKREKCEEIFCFEVLYVFF
jgi:hypothetical protein